MTIDIKGTINPDEKTRRYVRKTIGSLENLLEKSERETAHVKVILKRVDRAHGNKYEAEVKLRASKIKVEAKDTTLNVLAALDIVRRKLALELKNSGAKRLPRRQNRV